MKPLHTFRLPDSLIDCFLFVSQSQSEHFSDVSSGCCSIPVMVFQVDQSFSFLIKIERYKKHPYQQPKPTTKPMLRKLKPQSEGIGMIRHLIEFLVCQRAKVSGTIVTLPVAARSKKQLRKSATKAQTRRCLLCTHVRCCPLVRRRRCKAFVGPPTHCGFLERPSSIFTVISPGILILLRHFSLRLLAGKDERSRKLLCSESLGNMH